MTFIVIVVALLLDQLLRPLDRLRLNSWYAAPLADWSARAEAAPAPLQFLAALAPSFVLAFAVGALAWGFASANIVLGFLWALLVLLLCLGQRNVTVEISAYLKARAAGDEEIARQAAAAILEREPPADQQQCGPEIAEAALLRVGDGLFSVLFWFALLGPLGAALFRSATTVSRCATADRPGSAYAQAAFAFKRVMDWVPLHLLAFTWAVAGGFDRVTKAMRGSYNEATAHWLDRGEALVTDAGRAAVHGIAADKTNEVELLHAAVDLIWRGIVIWLAVIGIIVLLVWVF